MNVETKRQGFKAKSTMGTEKKILIQGFRNVILFRKITQNSLVFLYTLKSAAQSFFLHQRLQVINDSVAELRPKVDVLDISDEDLKPVQNTLDNLFTEALAVSTKASIDHK